jgi:hypothetical protein
MPTHLFTPFEDNDRVKALGAKWDSKLKTWYVPDGVPLASFERWLRDPSTAPNAKLAQRCPLSQRRMQAVFAAVQTTVLEARLKASRKGAASAIDSIFELLARQAPDAALDAILGKES